MKEWDRLQDGAVVQTKFEVKLVKEVLEEINWKEQVETLNMIRSLVRFNGSSFQSPHKLSLARKLVKTFDIFNKR